MYAPSTASVNMARRPITRRNLPKLRVGRNDTMSKTAMAAKALTLNVNRVVEASQAFGSHEFPNACKTPRPTIHGKMASLPTTAIARYRYLVRLTSATITRPARENRGTQLRTPRTIMGPVALGGEF